MYPNDGWKTDIEFQNDCLAFALFYGQNKISSTQGVNHWIPFIEQEVNARERFKRHFMTDFIGGKLGADVPQYSGETASFGVVDNLFESNTPNFTPTTTLVFSPEATAVFDAGRELWRYYHTKHSDIVVASAINKYKPNVFLYDIRGYFQGKMKPEK